MGIPYFVNMSRDEMAFESMKELYHLRWNEETSFRALKYNIGLVHFHSKKRAFIQQEIYARLIMFNLSKAIVNMTDAEKQGKKYKYKADYASALTNIRAFMRKLISVEKLIKEIKRNLAPIRPDQSFKRDVRPKSTVPFAYRPS